MSDELPTRRAKNLETLNNIADEMRTAAKSIYMPPPAPRGDFHGGALEQFAHAHGEALRQYADRLESLANEIDTYLLQWGLPRKR